MGAYALSVRSLKYILLATRERKRRQTDQKLNRRSERRKTAVDPREAEIALRVNYGQKESQNVRPGRDRGHENATLQEFT